MLNVAVIGCAGIGGVHLARWSNVSGAHIAAVCDTDSGIAHRTAAEFGTEAHSDWRSLLDGSGFDVVDICLPTNEHHPAALLALRNGSNVLCQVPLAINPRLAREMVEAAESTGKLLMPAFSYRFHPPVIFARELVQNDDLGRIVMFRSRFSGRLAEVETQWISDPEISGGGVLMDTAVHSIDLFRCLTGEVKSASGRTATVNPKLAVEDTAAIVLHGETGAIGTVECSWSTPGGSNALELYGTAGACIVDFDTERVRYRTAEMSVWETREIEGPDRYDRLIAHFADAVRGIQPLDVSGIDGLRANEIVAEVLS